MRFEVALCLLLAGILGVAGTATAQQTPYIVDADTDALYSVDPATGDRTVVSGCEDTACTTIRGTGPLAPPNFQFARGVFVEPNGQILVADGDLDDLNNNKTLFRVDPVSGDRTVVSSSLAGNVVGAGDAFDTLFDVILDANGDILVSDTAIDTIFRVDPVSGDRTVLSSNTVGTGPEMTFPGDLQLERDGDILATEGGNDQVLRVDPVTGDRTIVSSSLAGSLKGEGIALVNLGGITLDRGRILIADEGATAVIAIDPKTGDRIEVSGPLVGSGPDLVDPYSIDVAADGTIYVADGAVGLVRVNPNTGERVVLSSATVGQGTPVTLLRDVRVEPLPLTVPLASPFAVGLIALLMLVATAVVLKRSRA